MRKVAQIMGMPITIDIPACQKESVFEKAFARLRQIDERFSTYKPGSEVSRYARGEIDEEQIGPELKKIIKACRQAEVETDGYFSAWASGSFEPSGYVKGWAAAEAGKIIEKAGFRTYCISAGGDVLARSSGRKTWQIGIQDPFNKNKILQKIEIKNAGIATSGSYERGAHIINPKSGNWPDYWASVTIIGPEIVRADVWATACFALGLKATEFMKPKANYQFIGIKNNQENNPQQPGRRLCPNLEALFP